MKKNMKWRYAMMPVALAALAAIPAQGCDQVTDAQNSLCCSEFTPGADLASVQWGLQGEAEANYGAFMQAVSDFTGVANAMVSDVANACQAIAVDLGSDPNEVTDTTPDGRASKWCAIAKGKIAPAANLTISAQPPSCRVNASVQASCEGRCSADVSCQITPAEIIARCDPGKLSGKCSADCTAKCEGSANLAVSCDGTCAGTCEGTCMGTCAVKDANGDCRGACEGKCGGQCRGSCTMDAGAKVQCEGQCTGGCSVEVTAPKCTAELKPPKAECNANVDCNASCSASASAKAECTEGSITIEGDANLEAIIATLKVNLPRLILVAQARGKVFVDNAQAIASLGGSLEITGSVKAGACIIPAGAAMAQAVKNAGASVSASADILASVNIGQ
jgi:hypothetical protein